MFLQKIYKLFPHCKRRQFRIKFVRNEIIVRINMDTERKTIIHYYNKNKIKLIIYDAKFEFSKQKETVLEAEGLRKIEKTEFAYNTNEEDLQKDIKKINKILYTASRKDKSKNNGNQA